MVPSQQSHQLSNLAFVWTFVVWAWRLAPRKDCVIFKWPKGCIPQCCLTCSPYIFIIPIIQILTQILANLKQLTKEGEGGFAKKQKAKVGGGGNWWDMWKNGQMFVAPWISVFTCSYRSSFVCRALLFRWLRVKDLEFEEIFIDLSPCIFLLPPSFTLQTIFNTSLKQVYAFLFLQILSLSG